MPRQPSAVMAPAAMDVVAGTQHGGQCRRPMSVTTAPLMPGGRGKHGAGHQRGPIASEPGTRAIARCMLLNSF